MGCPLGNHVCMSMDVMRERVCLKDLQGQLGNFRILKDSLAFLQCQHFQLTSSDFSIRLSETGMWWHV